MASVDQRIQGRPRIMVGDMVTIMVDMVDMAVVDMAVVDMVEACTAVEECMEVDTACMEVVDMVEGIAVDTACMVEVTGDL